MSLPRQDIFVSLFNGITAPGFSIVWLPISPMKSFVVDGLGSGKIRIMVSNDQRAGGDTPASARWTALPTEIEEDGPFEHVSSFTAYQLDCYDLTGNGPLFVDAASRRL